MFIILNINLILAARIVYVSLFATLAHARPARLAIQIYYLKDSPLAGGHCRTGYQGEHSH
jgi:hypothetical protein